MRTCVILAVVLAGSSVAWGQEPTRDWRAAREQAQLIRDLVRIIQNQTEIAKQMASGMPRCGRHPNRFPQLKPPVEVTIPAGEKSAVVVGIDWCAFTLTEMLVKLTTSPADADVEIPAELIIVEEKSPERFEVPVKAGKTPGTFKLVVVPSHGEPIEFKVVVK